MATLVLDPYAYELDALKERRRVSGLDRLDEVGRVFCTWFPLRASRTHGSPSSWR